MINDDAADRNYGGDNGHNAISQHFGVNERENGRGVLHTSRKGRAEFPTLQAINLKHKGAFMRPLDFSMLKINLVRHDDSPTGMPAYIEVNLEHTPKDKSALVLDLGNYIYRVTGIAYEMTPEFRGRGKATTIRWFISWKGLAPILDNIFKAYGKKRILSFDHLPYEFYSLIIQNPERGVHAQSQQRSES